MRSFNWNDAKRYTVRGGVPPIEELRLGLLPVEAFEVEELFIDDFTAE